MLINDPISQLEVYGLLFPNCRSQKSLGILIAQTYPLPLSLPDEEKTGKKKKETTWVMSKYLKRLMWCRALSLTVSEWEKKSAETKLKIWAGENMPVYFFISAFLSLSPSPSLFLWLFHSLILSVFLFFPLPLSILPCLIHLVCQSVVFHLPPRAPNCFIYVWNHTKPAVSSSCFKVI